MSEAKNNLLRMLSGLSEITAEGWARAYGLTPQRAAEILGTTSAYSLFHPYSERAVVPVLYSARDRWRQAVEGTRVRDEKRFSRDFFRGRGGWLFEFEIFKNKGLWGAREIKEVKRRVEERFRGRFVKCQADAVWFGRTRRGLVLHLIEAKLRSGLGERQPDKYLLFKEMVDGGLRPSLFGTDRIGIHLVYVSPQSHADRPEGFEVRTLEEVYASIRPRFRTPLLEAVARAYRFAEG